MISAERLGGLAQRFCGQRVLVVGDVMLDRYVRGHAARISPEAPVPVVRVTSEESRAGGAANVALNVRALGGSACVAGRVGQDASASALLELLLAADIDVGGIAADETWQTTVKTRVVADGQQVVRVDRERAAAWDGGRRERFLEGAERLLDGVDALVLEDYGKGVIDGVVAGRLVRAARERRLPVAYDPHPRQDAAVRGITVGTPNYREACMAARLPELALREPPYADEDLQRVGSVLLEAWEAEFVLVTLGAEGMCVCARGRGVERFATAAREVFDVSGAGDTVVAAAALALASGAAPPEAARLANAAAGVVVGKAGTAVCDSVELFAVLRGAPGKDVT